MFQQVAQCSIYTQRDEGIGSVLLIIFFDFFCCAPPKKVPNYNKSKHRKGNNFQK